MSRSRKFKVLNSEKTVKALTIFILLILALPLVGGELSKGLKNDTQNIGLQPDLTVPGFVFSRDLTDKRGLSIDYNANGIEDFIEINKPLFYSNTYLQAVVTLKVPASDWLVTQFEDLGCVDVEMFTIIDAIGAKIPSDKINAVSKLPGIELIQSVHETQRNINNAVPLIRASQSILNSNGYSGINGEGVTIAVIDTGISGSHSAFTGRIIAFKDYWHNNDDLDPTDGMNAQDYGADGVYHGTMVTSCAASSGTYKGVAPKAYIIMVAVDNTYQMIQGIQWCVNNKNTDFNRDGERDGPDIISMSMGVQGTMTYLDNAAGSAMDNGVVFVTSAGNDGPNDYTVTSPANSVKVISVGATNNNKVITSFSSRGPGPGGIIKPNVVAPGLNLLVAWPGNQWVYGGTGTSFSCPLVAGVCALLLQYDPDLSPSEVKQILENSAEDLGDEGPDNTYGWGFVNAVGALDLVLKVKSLTASSKNVIEDTSVTFTAVASGTNVNKYEWDWENDGFFNVESSDNSIQHVFTDAGDYTVVVRVTNNKGKTAETSIDIKVINREPDAKLELDGALEYIYEDEIIYFNATKSWDTQSDIVDLEFAWSFNNGLNFTNFSKEDGVFGYSFNKSGEYEVYVIVRDDNKETDQEKISLKVENLKPIADAGHDMIVFEDELVHFSGVGTYDTKSDLDSLEYTWNFGDRTEDYGMNVTHSYQIEEDNQTFNVVLTVVDDENEKSESKIKVTVRNRPPNIAIMDDVTGVEDQVISFHGVGNDSSTDVNDLSYKWLFDDGTNTEWLMNPNVTHMYTEVGTYHPTLLVKDPKEAIGQRTLNITITNVKPNAKFVMSKSSAEEDEWIEFDASGTIDTISDQPHLTYIWDFGDSTAEIGEKVSHRFYKAKRYTITLMVKDDNGAFSTFEDKLSISNRMPSAKITPMKKEYYVNEIVTFLGYQSTDTPSDLKNLTYYWDFRDGSGFQVGGINTTFKYTKPGEYVVRLKVEDDDFETDIKKIGLTIMEEEQEEDILANPTFENRGMYIYSGIGIFIVFLILMLVSLLMYYKGKRGIFGAFERRMIQRRERREREKNLDEERINQIGPTGLTVGQEQFYQDLYGIDPKTFQNNQNQGQSPMPNNSFNNTSSHGQPGLIIDPKMGDNISMPMPPPTIPMGMMQSANTLDRGPVLPKLPPRKDEEQKDLKEDVESTFLEEDENWLD
jgi:serine protease AprX